MDSGVMSNSSSLAWHWGIRSSLQLRVDFHLTSISIVREFYTQMSLSQLIWFLKLEIKY